MLLLEEKFDLYKKFGLLRVINAATCLTRLGGSKPDPCVFDVMKEASRSFIRIPALQSWAGEVIADAFGAEAALPTSGASNALQLATAACIFRDTELEDYDPLDRPDCTDIIQRLPLRTAGLKTDFIVMKSDRNVYDHSVECVGGRLIEAGSKHKVSEEDLIKAYHPESTAAYYYTVQVSRDIMPLAEFSRIAHEQEAPVIVDAAPNLTHKEIPHKLIEDGADLLIFSGGKHLGGPNNTGLLVGRGEIKLAHLNAYPFDGIGRAAKMSRETIMGLVKALELWFNRDEDAYYQELEGKSHDIADKLNEIPGVSSGVIYEPTLIPELSKPSYAYIELNENAGITLKGLHEKLLEGEPPIETLLEPLFITNEAGGRITIKAAYLLPEDEEIIIERIKTIMKQ
ncbi:MAG: aminotransferase class V-fold PLP-dependent enzyme [Candidatus Bathyarchaeia archaeon]